MKLGEDKRAVREKRLLEEMHDCEKQNGRKETREGEMNRRADEHKEDARSFEVGGE